VSDRALRRLQPPLPCVSVQGGAEGRRFDPGLEVGDPLPVPLKLAVYGVLKSFNQLLEMSHPRFEGVETSRVHIGRARRRRICGGDPAEMPYPRDQALPFTHAHRLSRRLD
jgi:hypothetical protein